MAIRLVTPLLFCFATMPAAILAQEATTENEDSAPQSISVHVERNLRYSDQKGRAGRCDVYHPSSPPPPPGHPMVIVVHGGAWISGDKWTLEGYSRLLANNGIIAITINYRLAPTHKFPCQVDDVRQAMLWTAENAKEWNGDVNRIGMFGYSAGGHLSALVATLADEPIDVRSTASHWPPNDPRWSKLPKIKALCAGGPPCNFQRLPIDNTTLAYFLGGSRRDQPETYVAASPIAHVSATDPITQIIQGEADVLVPIAGSRAFHEAQQSAGVESRFLVIEKQGHMLTFLNPQTSKAMADFFKEVLFDSKDKADFNETP